MKACAGCESHLGGGGGVGGGGGGGGGAACIGSDLGSCL